MGLLNSKIIQNRKDEATSNDSLLNVRYITIEKPKWIVFRKKETKAIPQYPAGRRQGCACGNTEPCRKRVTPRGVTIHYPQKRKRLNFNVKSSW